MMSANITLMVRPNTFPDDPPVFLLEENGVWREIGAAVRRLRLSEVRTNINKRLNELMEIIEQGPPPAGWTPQDAWYSELFLPLFPEKLYKLLDQSAWSHDPGDTPPILRIHIDATIEWIPWEIMHDGTDFIGLRYQVARLPIMPT